MKRHLFILTAVCVLVYSHLGVCYGEILWLNDFQQFRFAVEKNGGSFFYEPEEYFSISSDTEVIQHNPVQGITGNYDGIATGQLMEYPSPIPGSLEMHGLAKGPDGGVNPINGLLVEGYLEVLPSDLGEDHGMDVEQKVVSFVSRRFRVDRKETVTVKAVLDGIVDFDKFSSNPNYFAQYTLVGTVQLEMIVEAENLVQPVSGFPLELNELVKENQLSTELVPTTGSGDEVKYQMIITLTLTSGLQNYNWATSTVEGPIVGDYKLGSPDSPVQLSTTLTTGQTAMPWLPLLLLGD